METNSPTSTTPARLHPLLFAAAISIIVFSAAGVAALTGVLPHSFGSTQPAAPAAAVLPAPVAAVAPLPETPAPETAPAAAKPAKKAAARRYAPVADAPMPAPVRMADASTRESPRAESAPEAAPMLGPAPVPLAEAKCADCGTIDAVREVEQQGKSSWVGPVAGGVGGGLLGKQFGRGTGNTLMTIVGAVGGAFAGHEIEKRVSTKKNWLVSVRFDDGSTQTLTFDKQPAWRAGERVRYVNGNLVSEQRS
jgi:outer membrane lipoprotein SlyB